MPDINDKERGIGPETKSLNRSLTLSKAPDAGEAPDGERESRYWRSPTRPHRVIFPNAARIGLLSMDVNFDFKPTGATGRSGVAAGTGIATSHTGKYQILKSAADSLVMQVTIGTAENPTEDIDATLSIDKSGATVKGTLKGEVQAAAKPVPVAGTGTAADPYQVKFPTQELDWYLP